jgi:hypothetical protein
LCSGEILGIGTIVAYNHAGVILTAKAMVFVRPTTAISRAELARDCLQELRLWPGCESVGTVGVLAGQRDRFTLHVIDYGAVAKRLADRALRCIEREKLRQYHLRVD